MLFRALGIFVTKAPHTLRPSVYDLIRVLHNSNQITTKSLLAGSSTVLLIFKICLYTGSIILKSLKAHSIHGVFIIARRAKKKLKTKLSSWIEEILSNAKVDSENIIRLKLTTRKGTRIKSVPLIILEKLANMKMLYWKLQDEWLIIYGLS